MKRLTLLASVLLTISATSVQAQSVICEKFGAGQIIANRVCPLGYVKKGEVGSNSNRGGITAGLQPMYDQLNNNAAERRERLAREAAAAEAQRQREHEERMLRLQKSQSVNSRQRNQERVANQMDEYALRVDAENRGKSLTTSTLTDEARRTREQYLERMSAQLDERQRSEEQANTSVNIGSSERGSNLVEDLIVLGKLHADGILTDEEFNAAKRRLLGL